MDVILEYYGFRIRIDTIRNKLRHNIVFGFRNNYEPLLWWIEADGYMFIHWNCNIKNDIGSILLCDEYKNMDIENKLRRLTYRNRCKFIDKEAEGLFVECGYITHCPEDVGVKVLTILYKFMRNAMRAIVPKCEAYSMALPKRGGR